MSEPDLFSEEELLERELWQDNDGDVWSLAGMSDDQIAEAIEEIEGQEGWRREWLPILLTEQERRQENSDEGDKDGWLDVNPPAPAVQVNTFAGVSFGIVEEMARRALAQIARELNLPPDVTQRLGIVGQPDGFKIVIEGGLYLTTSDAQKLHKMMYDNVMHQIWKYNQVLARRSKRLL